MQRASLLVILLSASFLFAQRQNTCVNCHEEMGNELIDPVREWKTSIHYEGGISCSDCHGGNPRSADAEKAMDPKAGFSGIPSPEEVPDFCGKCHSAVRDNFMESAHAQALLEDGTGPSCITCHTAHQQKKVSLDLINEESCGSCHDYGRARKLKEAMRAMETDLTSMESRVATLFQEGLDVESEQRALFALRNRTHRLTHVLNISKILYELGGVRSDLQGLDARVQDQEKVIRHRKKLGAFLILFFLVGALIAGFYHKLLTQKKS